MQKIGIVILNYNTFQMTIALIKNLKAIQNEDIRFEIVVVDNGSQNDSVKMIKRYIKDDGSIYFIQNVNNLGYAGGNNIGLKYCRSLGLEYALVTNNDIEISSINCILSMINVMKKETHCAAVSPRIISKEGKKDPPIYFRKPEFKDFTYGIVGNQKERFRFDEFRTCRIYAPRGSFMLLKLKALEQIGYLDENTFLYYEEPIMAERLLLKGFECWHCGEETVIHNHGKTISSVLKKKRTCQILCESLDYYLKEYRKMNTFKRKICIVFRTLVYMRR